jgi:hypothetical protein
VLCDGDEEGNLPLACRREGLHQLLRNFVDGVGFSTGEDFCRYLQNCLYREGATTQRMINAGPHA